jgi:hypothetical protein
MHFFLIIVTVSVHNDLDYFSVCHLEHPEFCSEMEKNGEQEFPLCSGGIYTGQ